jgi:hypothetical protein
VLDVPVEAKASVEHAESNPQRTPKEYPIVVIDGVTNAGDYDDWKSTHVLQRVVQTLHFARIAKLTQTL